MQCILYLIVFVQNTLLLYIHWIVKQMHAINIVYTFEVWQFFEYFANRGSQLIFLIELYEILNKFQLVSCTLNLYVKYNCTSWSSIIQMHPVFNCYHYECYFLKLNTWLAVGFLLGDNMIKSHSHLCQAKLLCYMSSGFSEREMT